MIHHLSELIYTDEQGHLCHIVMRFQNSIENFCNLAQSCHITILYTDVYCMILRLYDSKYSVRIQVYYLNKYPYIFIIAD